MSSEHMPLLQGYTGKFAPKWLGPFVIDEVVSPVAYHVDLPPSYRLLHLVYHVSQLRPHIGPVPDIELPVVLSDNDVESEYEVKQVFDTQNI